VIVATLSLLGGPLTSFLEANASWLILDFADDWPVLVKGVLALALGDFLNWFAHLVKHKVPLFWRFHMIHHSQTRMSLFTSNRTHPLDTAIGFVLLFLPSLILFPSLVVDQTSVLLYIGFLAAWLERYQHCNIRTNLGPLRWIFVSPQAHRVHHSTEPEHWNSNYATVFAWDRLFGTQHADVTSYPTTGINDRFFPEPTSWSLREFANGFVGQMLFPFDSAAVRRASVGSPHESPAESIPQN
jgi:sterol desaturase/sphingolipid hydroxylase (fatty acid hydroxylase superfamily)